MSQRMTRAAAKKFGAESGSDPSPSGLDLEGSQANPSGYNFFVHLEVCAAYWLLKHNVQNITNVYNL